MQATEDLPSPSVSIGGLGLWIQAEERMAWILPGLRQSLSSSSSSPLLGVSPTMQSSWYLETTEESLKGGGEGGAATILSMKYSGGYISWSETWESQYAQNLSLQKTTKQTHHPEGSIPLLSTSSHTLGLVHPSNISLPMSSWTWTAWEGEAEWNLGQPAQMMGKTQDSPGDLEAHLTKSSSFVKPSKKVVILVNIGIHSEENILRAAGQDQPSWWYRTLDHSTQPEKDSNDRSHLQAGRFRTPQNRYNPYCTTETYGTSLAAFHWFCDQAGIPEVEHAPASRETLEVFAAVLAGVYSPSTINNYLAGIRAWHIIHGLELKTHKPTMDALLKVAMVMALPDAQRAKRPPLQLKKIQTIKALLDLKKPLGVAIFACLTTTFWGTTRLGEFTLPDKIHFDKLIHISSQDQDGGDWGGYLLGTATKLSHQPASSPPKPPTGEQPSHRRTPLRL
ncbi:hypothetical protein APHAL10511_003920 [Amanita phalloides]|nr:hypothetical protein APHAL10511_003920 [Amanita phalloides]